MYRSRILSAVASLALATGFSPDIASAEDSELEVKGSASLSRSNTDNDSKLAKISNPESGRVAFKNRSEKIKSDK